MVVHVGTSGWQYADWRGAFYPSRLPQRSWLEFYASHFATVEVNNTFYRLPEAGVFEDWAARTPGDFVIGVKASRYLTHVKRLSDPEEPVRRLLERAGHLKAKLGPALLQLPGNFKADIALLRDTLEAFPPEIRIAFEPRHRSWYRDDVAMLLSEHDAAWCLSDTRSRPSPIRRTADWTYVRFHGGLAHPAPCYGRVALRSWAERIAENWDETETCFAYFNNDRGACAVRDARAFSAALRRVGLTPTRVPGRGEVLGFA